MFRNSIFFSNLNFRTKTYNLSMKIHFEADKDWIFAPKIIKKKNNFWREDSNFILFDMNIHAKIRGFGAKIKVVEKFRIFE